MLFARVDFRRFDMDGFLKRLIVFALIPVFALMLVAPALSADTLDIEKIDQAIGVKGVYHSKQKTYRISFQPAFPAQAGNKKILPAMGFSSWASFRRSEKKVIFKGEFALLERQVNPALKAALDSGLEPMALHTRYSGEEPRIYSLHLSGAGNEESLARAIRKVLDRSRESIPQSRQRPPMQASLPAPASQPLDTQAIEGILKIKGERSGEVFRVSEGRTALFKSNIINGPMGVASWAAFTGTAPDAMVNGELAVNERSLTPVLKAIVGAGLEVTAISNHFLNEDPRLVYVHFIGKGDAQNLARAIKAAFDAEKKTRQPGKR